MKITLEYSDLKIIVIGSNPTTSVDCVLISSAALEKTQELGYGKPTINFSGFHTLRLKNANRITRPTDNRP